jgi:hypothetical protein
MWVNTYKTESKHPDYQIYEDNFKPKEQNQPLVKDDLEF